MAIRKCGRLADTAIYTGMTGHIIAINDSSINAFLSTTIPVTGGLA
jgi:hypothetical protein